ncbi:MAG: hypothetical protein J6D18_02890, partial [Erysipelotrichaceae bacterium]|nr:hypothetical protein [Erysipelotrichaceae bacterium]
IEELTPAREDLGTSSEYLIEMTEKETDFNKNWDKDEGSEEVTVHVEWSLDAEKRIDQIHKALTVKGVQEETISYIIAQVYQVNESQRAQAIEDLNNAYLEAKGKPLPELLKRATVGWYESLILDAIGVPDQPISISDYAKAPTETLYYENGKFYVDIVLRKSEGWKKTVTGILFPDEFYIQQWVQKLPEDHDNVQREIFAGLLNITTEIDLTEIVDLENNTMKWNGNAVDGYNVINTWEEPEVPVEPDKPEEPEEPEEPEKKNPPKEETPPTPVKKTYGVQTGVAASMPMISMMMASALGLALKKRI